MANRGRKIRIGRHLIVDDRSGVTYWDDEIVKDWDGLIVKKGQEDGEHPQWFVRAQQDPYPLHEVRPLQGVDFDTICGYYIMEYIPRTTIKRQLSQNDNLLELPGVGQMSIGDAADQCGYWFVVGPAEQRDTNFPQLSGSNTSTTLLDTTHMISIHNDSDPGERVILSMSAEGSVVFTWPAGWTLLFEDTGANVSLSIYYRDLDGTEGFTGTDDFITVTTDITTTSSHIAYAFEDFDSAVAPEISVGTTGTDNMPDSDNIAPTFGDSDYVVLTVEGHNSSSTDVTQPNDYDNFITSSS